MPHVVFIAPRFLENTNRYVRAFAALDGVTLSLVSADPEEAIPAPLRARVAGHYRVTDCLDGAQLTQAVRALARSVGPGERRAGRRAPRLGRGATPRSGRRGRGS